MKMSTQIREWNHRRIDGMRALALATVALLFDSRSCFVARESTEKIILVLRLDSKIGDSVTATGFLRELKKNFPEHQLWVVTDTNTQSIYENLKCVDRVWVLSKGLWPSLRLYAGLKKHAFHFIINTSHLILPRVIFLVSRLRAFRKVTFQSQDYQLFSDHVRYEVFTDHVTSRYGNTLKLLGVPAADLSYEFPQSEATLARAKAELKKIFPQPGPIVVLNSFAGARLRSFNKQTTTAIVQGLLEKNPSLKILSIGNQNDRPLVKNWSQEYANPQWQVSHSSDLAINMALVSLADLVITPDTALVHIASAFKKPLVAIFRGDGEEKNSLTWAPYGTDFRMIQTTNKLDQEPDINQVNIQQILIAANDLLSKKNI